MSKIAKPYGTWSSAITPRAISEVLNLSDVQWDNQSDTLVWSENRGARGVLVAQSAAQAPRDITEDSVRAQVGYGGGSFTVSHGHVYFAATGGRLYRQSLTSGQSRPITPAFGAAASPRLSADGKWCIYVHSYEGTDGLALVDSSGESWPQKFAYGTDFVMQPVWQSTGEYIAYIGWNHPQMPWDGTELRLVTLEYLRDGTPYPAAISTLVGDQQTAIMQPEFSPDGRFLAYISDQTGWNQLYIYDIATHTHTRLTHAQADYGTPAWIQGIRVYAWENDSRHIICTSSVNGFKSLQRIDILHPQNQPQPLIGVEPYTDFSQLAIAPLTNRAACIAAAPTITPRVISIDLPQSTVPPTLAIDPALPGTQVLLNDSPTTQIHRRASTENLPSAALSNPEAITWEGHDGESAHGLYYPPASERSEGIGAPPLIVYVHGGPTSQVTATYSGVAQFFATRGYAVLMVNHRGSTGYGRDYMNKLRGNWGVYDVQDSATGASYLAQRGLADPGKCVIMGGSAGGYTVLQSLVDKPGFYKAGVCLYGISNQFMLVMDTHKFEERYSDSLLGVLPQAADVYRDRSPLYHAHKIVDPVIIFQGEEDTVVPRNQSDAIVESLRARGVPHQYHVYAGEGHGFRKPETLEHYYNAVIKFLTQYVVFS